MIILDTHIWVWWVNEDPRLTKKYLDWIDEYQSQGLGISIISCWEVAKLVELNRINLSIPVDEWLTAALAYPGIERIELTIPIIVESTKLIGFHRDPSDQIIVATSKVYDCPLMTADTKIITYPNVNTLN